MAIVENKVLERFVEIAYTTLLIILVSIVVGLIMAFPVMWLWNFVFGTILKINVFQAWALNVLSGILFGRSHGNKEK